MSVRSDLEYAIEYGRGQIEYIEQKRDKEMSRHSAELQRLSEQREEHERNIADAELALGALPTVPA